MVETSLFARYVPRLVAERPPGPQAFTFDGSLVFADVSGFTKLSERLAEQGKAGAEELTAILNDRFTDLLTESFAEGGDLLKYGGDALLLAFRGAHHSDRACRAAARMRAKLRERGPIETGRGKVTLRVSQGVHSGTFQCFLAGEAQRELILAGGAASEVTAMETAAEAGEILVSTATAALLPASCVGSAKGPGRLLRRTPPVAPVPALVESTAAHDDPQRFVPTLVRGRVLAGVEEAEHRYVTVGFLHVFGLDELVATLPADEVLDRLHRLVCLVEDASGAAGICLISSDIADDGTKLILTAGAPDAVEDGEGTMLSVLRTVLDGCPDLALHAGVNAGHVFAGEVGAPFRRVYTVIGDAVNLAARLMGKALPGQLLVHAPTLERAKVEFAAEPLPPFMVKGKSRPIEAYEIGVRIGAKARARTLVAELVGRDVEMRRLEESLESARGHHGHCVTLSGPAGIGKSRLIEEFLARHPEVPVTRITAEPSVTERPYLIARLVLRRALGIDLDADAQEAGRVLTEISTRRLSRLAPMLPLLGLVVDAEVGSTPEVDQIAAVHRPRVLTEVAAEAINELTPRLHALVVDGAEWVDEPSAAIFTKALETVGERPWLVLLTSRGGAGGLAASRGFDTHTLELGPLDATHVAALASALIGEAAVSAHDIEVLCTRSGGNPLFLIELITARMSAGSMGEVPSSLEDLVTSRIDRLSPSDRRALRYCSVLGERFPTRLAQLAFADALPGVDDPALWDRLGEFIVPERRGDRRFAFDLARHVAYEGLPYLRRRELHERVGLALERSVALRKDDPVSLLSLHFDQARDHTRAWRYSCEAGSRALAQYATVEAATFFERAVHHGRTEGTAPPDELAKVAEQLGDACEMVGRYERAQWGYRLARSLHGAADPDVPRVMRKEGVVRERQGRYAAALSWYRRAMQAADELPDPQRSFETSELAVAYAGVRFRQGKVADCANWCRRALVLAERGGNRRVTAHAYYLLDGALTDLGDPEADAVRGLALPIFEELGDLQGQSNVLNNLGVDALYAGNWDEAARWWEQCRDVRRRAGDAIGIAEVSHNVGEVRSDQGRFAEADALMRGARRSWRAANYPLGVAASTSGLGRLAVREGRADEGLAELRDALELFKTLQASAWVWETEARVGEALVYAGRHEEALEHIETVLAAYDRAKAPLAAAPIFRVQSLARAALDDREGAAEAMARALELAQEAGSAFDEALCRHERAVLGLDEDRRDEDLEVSARLFEQLGVEAAKVVAPTLSAWHT